MKKPNEFEEVAENLNNEHGSALVGLFYVGDMKMNFASHLAEPVTEASIKEAFTTAGKHLAFCYRSHCEKGLE